MSLRGAVSGRWLTLAAALCLTGCGGGSNGDSPAADVAGQPSLAAAFEDAFRIGVALNHAQITGADPIGRALAGHHFSSVTATNAMKWERIHPRPGVWDFELADRLVALAEDGGLEVVGHTLIWHQQTPDWVFRDSEGGTVSRDTLLARMREHIETVVGRYRGRVAAWDVVNEALADDGSLRSSPWLQIIGEDYIARAFEFAREADPDAVLLYNDYSLPDPARRRGAVALVRRLRAAGAPVDAIGLQGHYHLDGPPVARLDSTLRAFRDLGVRLAITELDVNVLPWPAEARGAEVGDRAAYRPELDPYPDSLPAAVQDSLARRYAGLFETFLAHADVVDRITFWGAHDGASWLNNWPVPGRTNHPLLFDRAGAPKPAFRSVLDAADTLTRP